MAIVSSFPREAVISDDEFNKKKQVCLRKVTQWKIFLSFFQILAQGINGCIVVKAVVQRDNVQAEKDLVFQFFVFGGCVFTNCRSGLHITCMNNDILSAGPPLSEVIGGNLLASGSEVGTSCKIPVSNFCQRDTKEGLKTYPTAFSAKKLRDLSILRMYIAATPICRH